MRIDFKTEDAYDYAKKRFIEMSHLNDDSVEAVTAYERIKNQINIRAAVRVFDGAVNGSVINIDGGTIECAPLKNTRGSLYAYALTVGEINLSDGTLEQTLQDMWGTAFVDAGTELLRNKIIADNPQKYVSHPFGPGFYGIKIDAIETIYNALDCKDAGIDLKNGLLSPVKSSIGFFLVTDNESDLPPRDCMNCLSDTSCEYCKNSAEKMVKIRFENENKTAVVPVGTTVTDAARHVGIAIETPCGGMGICGKCDGIIDVNGYIKTVKLCTERACEDMTAYTKICSNGDTKININRLDNGKYDSYSLAVDIGTTTLEVMLMGDTKTVAYASALNPQAEYSADVIGRIRLASDSGIMHTLIVDAINAVINEILDAAAINREQINKCVISGNTVMQCIASGVNPQELGRYPYNLPDTFGREIPAADLGINLSCGVYFPPVISAFVGGDIACGIVCSRLWERDKTLLIDIGTNGEIAYVKNGKITAASAAAGPAFEGMGITFGMRAKSGAVSKFKIVNRSTVMVETIDKASVVGICGSGLLEIIAELRKNGIITEDGNFCDKRTITSPIRNRICEYNSQAAFKICGEVYLTQADIRQVQLAKGAIRAAVEMIASDAERVIIAGAFGKHTSEESLIGCGILPETFRGKIEFAGNTSLEGGRILLDDTDLRDRIHEIASNTNTVMLSDSAEFERLFVKYMNME